MFKAGIQACLEQWAFGVSHCCGQKRQEVVRGEAFMLEFLKPQPFTQQQRLAHGTVIRSYHFQ